MQAFLLSFAEGWGGGHCARCKTNTVQWWLLNIGHSANRRSPAWNSLHIQTRVGGLCQGGKSFLFLFLKKQMCGLEWMCLCTGGDANTCSVQEAQPRLRKTFVCLPYRITLLTEVTLKVEMRAAWGVWPRPVSSPGVCIISPYYKSIWIYSHTS